MLYLNYQDTEGIHFYFYLYIFYLVHIYLLDQFSIEDIIVARRQNGTSTFERLNAEDYDQWLEDYTLGELWTKNVIDGGTVHE